jgi:DNA invertase Pin-like site-specific DNA recombinase
VGVAAVGGENLPFTNAIPCCERTSALPSKAVLGNNVLSNTRHTVSGTLAGMGDLLGYARVSTTEQKAHLQTDALKKAGCIRVWTDKASGSLDHRPKLEAVLDHLRPGDTLVVWRLDRLGRNLRHLIATVNDLAAAGIGFKSLTEGIDTTTPAGRLTFHLFGALAEFERELIRERTAAGLAAARARGRSGGRPRVMTPEKLAVARQIYDSRGHTLAAIGAVVGVSRSTLYRYLGDRGRPEPSQKSREETKANRIGSETPHREAVAGHGSYQTVGTRPEVGEVQGLST